MCCLLDGRRHAPGTRLSRHADAVGWRCIYVFRALQTAEGLDVEDATEEHPEAAEPRRPDQVASPQSGSIIHAFPLPKHYWS